MKFLAPIFLLLSILAIAAPNPNAEEVRRGVYKWQCIRSGQKCYHDTGCCSGHCVFNDQPFYQFHRRGKCANPSTISTSTPCTPSYGYYTDIGTRTAQSAGRIVTVTYTSVYTAIYDPPCAFGDGGGSSTTTSSRGSSTSTTTPCLPSYSYYTTLETQTTQSASRTVTVTYTRVYTAIFDPPCAFGGGGSGPGSSTTPPTSTTRSTSTRSSTTTSPCLPSTFYVTQKSVITTVSGGHTQTYTSLNTITGIADPACAFGG